MARQPHVVLSRHRSWPRVERVHGGEGTRATGAWCAELRRRLGVVLEPRDECSQSSIVGPVEDPFGNTKVSLQLETVVDRTKFGLNWNAPLPKGGFMLANDVTLSVDLELVQG